MSLLYSHSGCIVTSIPTMVCTPEGPRGQHSQACPLRHSASATGATGACAACGAKVTSCETRRFWGDSEKNPWTHVRFLGGYIYLYTRSVYVHVYYIYITIYTNKYMMWYDMTWCDVMWYDTNYNHLITHDINKLGNYSIIKFCGWKLSKIGIEP